jgi:hypothetical protein
MGDVVEKEVQLGTPRRRKGAQKEETAERVETQTVQLRRRPSGYHPPETEAMAAKAEVRTDLTA